MRELIWSLVFSNLVLFLTALLLRDFQIESILELLIAGFMIGLLNFIIAPMLIILKARPGIFSLGFITFVLNFMVLNVSTGLIDNFGLNSWVAALFGAVIMAFFQIFLDRKDPTRRILIG